MGLVLFYILSRNPSDALKKAKCKPKFPLILPGIPEKSAEKPGGPDCPPAGCSGVGLSLTLPQGGVGVGRTQAEVRPSPVWPPVRPFLPLPLQQQQAAAATAIWTNYRAAFDTQYSVSQCCY